MSEPRMVNAQLALAEAWQQQLFQDYWRVQELLARCQMVGAALQIRDEDPAAMFVVFEDSDQGPYAYLCGGAVKVDGEWNEDVDNDLGHWELRYDVVEHWAPYLDRVPTDRSWGHFYLDIEKVLAEVEVPWAPVKPVLPSEHGPVTSTWFTVGMWPTCSCGFDPRDNEDLIAHWRGFGFEVVEDHGRLVRVPTAPVSSDV